MISFPLVVAVMAASPWELILLFCRLPGPPGRKTTEATMMVVRTREASVMDREFFLIHWVGEEVVEVALSASVGESEGR